MTERISVPKGGPSAPAPPRKEVGLDRILEALQTADRNAADRMKDLKVFLIFLPLIWGVIWGILYVIYLSAR